MPMKMRHPGASRALSSRRAISCASSSSSSSLRTRSRSAAARLVDEVGLAANDQHGPPGMILAPGGEARSDQLGRGCVDRFLALADLGPEPGFGLGERQPRQARVDEIADLAERGGACACGQA